METASQIPNSGGPAAPRIAGTDLARRPEPGGRRLGWVLMLILAALYACLYNIYWQPGGSDDAYYLTLARGLARGEGFVWQGVPVLTVPPLWPLLLAGVMKLTSSMAVLNLLPLVSSWLAAGAWYAVLLRLTAARQAFVTVLVSALLYRWFAGTIHHYSEGPFMLFSGLAILMGLHIREGRPCMWRAPVLVLMCCAMVLTRWPGVFLFPLIAAALLRGELIPRLNRFWIIAVIAAGAIVGSYYGAQWAMHRPLVTAEKKTREQVKALEQEDRRMEKMVGESARIYISRGANGGSWLAGLLWPPLEMGNTGALVTHTANGIGWVLLGMWLWRLVVGCRARDWVWLGVVVYVVSLFLMWPRPVPRYILPVAPLLILGMWQGLTALCALSGRAVLSRAGTVLIALTLGTTLLCNLVIWGISAYVARSPRFHEMFLAGEYRAYSEVAESLRRLGVRDGDVVIGQGSKAVNASRNSRFTQRMLAWMADQRFRIVGGKAVRGGPTSRMARWATRAELRYYLHRPDQQPRRLWHLDHPTLARLGLAKPPTGTSPAYLELYRTLPEAMEKIDPAPARAVSRVPGL